MRPSITLLTDFGTQDSFVGQMKGVILNINPEVNIIDLSHEVAPFGIKQASVMIGLCYEYFPLGTVHVAVVDPGVGTERRPIIVSNGDHFFVGPDNGIFSPVIQRSEKKDVFLIENDEYFLRKGSMTFQGRDIFAPVAAWITKGINPGEFGKKINDFHVHSMAIPVCRTGRIEGEVMYVDRFGNAITNISLESLETAFFSSRPDTLSILFNNISVPIKRYYQDGEGEELCALFNSDSLLELFRYRGNASRDHSIDTGALVVLVSK